MGYDGHPYMIYVPLKRPDRVGFLARTKCLLNKRINYGLGLACEGVNHETRKTAF
jgi:hypothetical protein